MGTRDCFLPHDTQTIQIARIRIVMFMCPCNGFEEVIQICELYVCVCVDVETGF